VTPPRPWRCTCEGEVMTAATGSSGNCCKTGGSTWFLVLLVVMLLVSYPHSPALVLISIQASLQGSNPSRNNSQPTGRW
jgi:hypothetical protein